MRTAPTTEDLKRMRRAQARVRHLLDVHYGPANTTEPAITSHTERDDLELAARTAARNLLTQNMREWLATTEHDQTTAAKTTIAQVLDLNVTDFIQTTAPPDTIQSAEAARDRDEKPHGRTEPGDPDTAPMLHQLVTLADWLTTAPITPTEPPVVDGPGVKQR